MLIPTYPIHTARLLLRPFCAEDLADRYAYHSQPEVTRFLYWEAPTRAETEVALAQKQSDTKLTAEGSHLSLAVVLPGAATARDTMIGEVSLVWRSQEHQQGKVGFVFNPADGGHHCHYKTTRSTLCVECTAGRSASRVDAERPRPGWAPGIPRRAWNQIRDIVSMGIAMRAMGLRPG